MIDILSNFLGITGDIPFIFQYFVVLAVLFMGVWLICNFINLFISSIFNIFN